VQKKRGKNSLHRNPKELWHPDQWKGSSRTLKSTPTGALYIASGYRKHLIVRNSAQYSNRIQPKKRPIMKPVVGVFKARRTAERAAAELVPLGIAKDRISILTADVTSAELAQLPTQAAEQPGMGKAMGATVGGAIGLAAGGSLPAILGSLLLPGVGPVLAIGLAGGVLGAVAGAVAGGAMESSTTEGLPEDELYVYENALRQGRSVVVAVGDDETQAEAVRGAFEDAGAESIDRAREMWWVGLRDAEKENYQAQGGNFDEDERYFRCGFEAAQRSANRGKSYEDCRARLGDLYPGIHEREPFRRGYKRGRAYFEALRKSATTSKS
jgi:hypothetical protein